jgi:HAD superfamily hydrolase (TIGR01509 family)
VPTWIFSNTNEIAVRLITEDFPFFRHFTGYVYSFETRSMKPDSGIYEALEQRAGARGAEIFYLDDRPENVAAGRARGWQALVHEDPAITIPAVCEALAGP